MKAKIGIGIVTYQRPNFFKIAAASAAEYLGDIADSIVAYHDGPRVAGYPVKSTKGIPIFYGTENRGVAHAKNWLLRDLMDRGCDYIFLMEDDLEILDRKAIVGYLAAHKMTNIPHLNFHGHGDNLFGRAMSEDGPLAFWPNAVGAWSFYTREILEQVGLMDENFFNAYEHVEHSWRIYRGHMDFGIWPDVIGSEYWIRAQEGALDKSSIRDQEGWQNRVRTALEYWKSIDPSCPANEPNWDLEQ